MENESEALYDLDSDQNLVIDDGTDKEIYDYNETNDPDFVPEYEQAEINPEKKIEEIKTSLKKKSLSPKERGQKLAELNKIQRFWGIDKKNPKSMSKKSGVIFSVKRVLKNMKKMFSEKIISQQAGVFLASVLEYMCSEVLDLSGEVAREFKKKRITPHFIQLSINDDEELNKLLKDTIIAQGGVTPYIHPELLVTKSTRYKKKQESKTLGEADQEAIASKYKKNNMVEHASQTESLEEIRATKQNYGISQININQSNAMLSPDITLVEEVPMSSKKKRRLSKSNIQTKIIQQSEITSAQVAPKIMYACLELSEINSSIDNITGINMEQTSTPTSQTESLVNRRHSLERILETENGGNNSDKNVTSNIESYLNVQADEVLNSKKNYPPAVCDVTLQNILKPLENHILVTDRKIIPNVLFKKSKFSKKKIKKFE